MMKIVEKISNEVLTCVLYLFSADRREMKLQPIPQETRKSRNMILDKFPVKACQ